VPPLRAQYDVLAGLSVAAMVIPQGMSYALLAGLPNVYGLYGAFTPPLFYSLLGTSRQLAVGPVAVTSMLLGNGLDKVCVCATGLGAEAAYRPMRAARALHVQSSPVQLGGSPARSGRTQVFPDAGTVNADPNNPGDPELQEQYNHAAVQVPLVPPPAAPPPGIRPRRPRCRAAPLPRRAGRRRPQAPPPAVPPAPAGGLPCWHLLHGRRRPAHGVDHALPGIFGRQRLHVGRLHHHRA
jgi:hypothetical protein